MASNYKTSEEKIRAIIKAKKEQRKSNIFNDETPNYESSKNGAKIPGFRKQREYGEKKRIKP